MPAIKFPSQSLTIRAAAPAPAAAKSPTVSILLYAGGLMTVADQGPLVIDLAGMEIGPTTPICSDHDTSLEATLGSGRASVVNGQLRVQGELVTTSESAKHILALNKSGTPLQASVGAEILESRPVRPGEQIRVNSRTIVAGPSGFMLVTKSCLREATICTFGADSSTAVSIAARAAQGKSIMTFEDYVTGLGFDPATLTPEQSAALQVSFEAAYPGGGTMTATAANGDPEVRRIHAVQAVAAGHPQIAATAIKCGWDAGRTATAVANRARPEGPANIRAADIDQAQVLECSLLLGQGVGETFIGRHFNQPTINAAMARENRGMGMHHVVNASLRAAGKSTDWQKVGQSQVSAAFEAGRMIRAGSTVSLPGILGNAANKMLLSAYESVPTTWRTFCGIQSAPDFKQYKGYRFTVTGELQEVGGSGEIKHLTMQEAEYANQLKTRGGMITLNRQTIINDDLQAFAAIPKNFGRLAAVGLEKAVYKKLLENVATIFTSTRGNYMEGAGDLSVFSTNSLSVAEKLFLDQVDSNGDPLMIQPSILAVPSSLSAASAVVVRSADIQHPADISTAMGVSNPHAGKFTPVVSPWLNNDNLTGSSDTAWYLFGTSGESGVIHVGFLDGQQNPTIEEGDVEFSQLGMSWRVYFDFGAAIGDYRFGVRSKGAAA